ncbi:MAG: hypothetical protein KAX49_17720 [Halanaerobiales bacterium]|nr:hypothetical protein [Halanaerobiales bacterium]
MKKIYKKLSKEQIEREVIFSSCLSEHTHEMEGDLIHEVKIGDKDCTLKIARLLDDSFFNDSHFKYNVVRKRSNNYC